MIMLYFSGTGNSKFIAQSFSKIMDCQCHSIEDDLSFTDLIGHHDTIAFCYPIYGSRVPKIMREFVSIHASALQNKNVIIFCTQLLFSGDGARALCDSIPDVNCRYICAEHFRMPNNISNIRIFSITSKEHNQKVKTRALDRLNKTCTRIKSGEIHLRGFNPFSKLLGLTQGLLWPGMERKMAAKVKIDSDCTECGLCTELCPVGNLELKNGSITANNKCICCYRCLNRCPQKAIYGLFGGNVKTQYRFIDE